MPAKRGSLTQAAERFEAEMALADMLMAIDARMERLERIVDMKRDEAIEPDVLVEFGESAVVALFRAQIVARSEGVLGIEAQPQPLVLVDRIEDPAHLFELVAEIAALPRRDFERDLRP